MLTTPAKSIKIDKDAFVNCDKLKVNKTFEVSSTISAVDPLLNIPFEELPAAAKTCYRFSNQKKTNALFVEGCGYFVPSIAEESEWGRLVKLPGERYGVWKNDAVVPAGTGFWYMRKGAAFEIKLPKSNPCTE